MDTEQRGTEDSDQSTEQEMRPAGVEERLSPSTSDTEDVKSKADKTTKPGIIYMSRVPPLMRPQRIKKIFSQYGEIGRVFLQPEDKFQRKNRRKKGGGRSKIFTEGWIEFTDKKIAKSVALTFNNTPIGGKKRSRYYEELWNLKYLHRFQWAHLAERLQYERQVRQHRIRTEITQAKRETNFYLKSVELGERLGKLEKKKREKGKEWIARVRAHRQKVTQEDHDKSKPGKSGKVTTETLTKIFKKAGQS
ncbi:activator of basal transcription 1-like [Diadema antillarum]|uniref:activator of basal transcription 1-like n=1 Tax=Diadema antillarum TaxID=105358 RepID=UPI003A838712